MRAIVGSLLALLASACQSPTQLIVWIDTDFEVPAELAAVQVIVFDALGETTGGEFFDLRASGVPMSFGIEGGALASEQVRILVQGLTANDELLVERNVVIEFSAGEKRLLPIFLARACAGASCGDDRTCSEKGCISTFVDVSTLPEIEPGDELLFDAGVHPDAGEPKGDAGADAGADSGADGGTADAALDAGDSGEAGDDGGDTGDAGDAAPADARFDAGDPDRRDGGLACTSNAECGPGELCEMSECRLACDAFSLSPSCPPDQACWYRQATNDGVCLHRDTSTAPNFRASCTMPSECDEFENFSCRPHPISPSECTSACRLPEDGFCQSRVPGTTCDIAPTQSIGLCLEPPQPVGDVGAPCMSDPECQSRCLGMGLNFCTASCNGLLACPAGSVCALSLDGIDAWCMRYCFSDTDCSNNPQFVCREDISFPGLCFYRCDNPIYPCPAGLSCDAATGHCF